jgi:hypothetical protein
MKDKSKTIIKTLIAFSIVFIMVRQVILYLGMTYHAVIPGWHSNIYQNQLSLNQLTLVVLFFVGFVSGVFFGIFKLAEFAFRSVHDKNEIA